MTGKGDRWGRDSVGRSAPAFLAASTTALPHLPALHGERQANFVAAVVFAARPANCGPFVSLRPVPGGESAGCVCLQCLFSRLCACSPFACHAHCPSQRSCPRSVCFCLLAPFISMCARINRLLQQFASCKTVLLAAATRACSGGPCAGPFDSF